MGYVDPELIYVIHWHQYTKANDNTMWDTTGIHYKNLNLVIIAYLPYFTLGGSLQCLLFFCFFCKKEIAVLKKWDCVLIFVLFTVWMKYLKDHTQPVCFACLCDCYYPGIRGHISHVDLS